MKKLFLFVLVLSLALSTTSYARAHFGVKAGLNLASASISPLQESESKKGITSFLVGASIEAPISEAGDFGLRGDVAYTQKGSKVTGDYFGTSYTVSGTFDELDISPYLIYNIDGIIEGARPFIQAGPELGIVISSTQKTEIEGQSTKSEDYKHASSTDFSLNFGAGIGLPLNNLAEVIFEIHYCLGLTDMDDTKDYTVKPRSFLFTVGYDFPPPGQGTHPKKHRKNY